jgi:predicted dehydrogenase
MAQKESRRDDGIDAVAIVTPNHLHTDPAIAFLEAGIHVICDKPLCATHDQAISMEQAVKKSSARFFLTHNYTGYPLIRQARAMVKKGDLGTVRVIQVEYAQDWLTEKTSNKQADWRTDPKQAGAGAIGDIGTHAFNLLSFVTGLKTQSLSADLSSFVSGRQVDDNAHIFLRLENEARAMLWASQVAVGNENTLRLRVYGSRGSIEWEQENPNLMKFTIFGQPPKILTRGGSELAPEAEDCTRVPPGHPEGYLEGFANLYHDIAVALSTNQLPDHLPGIDEGMAGMWFIHACIESAKKNSAWVLKD